jgi:hypothetical protein
MGVFAAASCQHTPDIAPNHPVAAPAQLIATPQPASSIDYRALGFSFPAAPSDDQSRARTDEQFKALDASCVGCHRPANFVGGSHTDRDSMHTSSVRLACVDCHGGPARPVVVRMNIEPTDSDYQQLKNRAHVLATVNPELWKSAAKPQNSYTALLKESPDFVRFINPGDLRAARVACASCHAEQVAHVPRSMMAHGAMLWEAATYNNGTFNRKEAIYGEEYAADGQPAELIADPRPTVGQARDRGLLPALFPLPRWEASQPGNILRVFEAGGRFSSNMGIPDPGASAGSPDEKLSTRGRGTNLSTDPVLIGLQKTRLLDPTLDLLGTNDHPGDYRSGGCTACHVVYANDRSPVHSAFWSGYGNRGESFSIDRTLNPARAGMPPTTQPYRLTPSAGTPGEGWGGGSVFKSTSDTTPAPALSRSTGRGGNTAHFPSNTEPANNPSRPARGGPFPVQHAFVRQMPTSTCIVCHVHPGTNVLNSYLGYMWWDNESDGRFMYPRKQVHPTPEQLQQASLHNPENAAVRGLWSDLYPEMENHAGQRAGPDFLENVTRLNPQLQHNQFADFHGHGWVFRAVFKKDRQGQLLDYAGTPVRTTAANAADLMRQGVEFQQAPGGPTHPPANVPVHLKDIHLEKGMQCVDCHFSTDTHGDGNLYGETRNAVTIECVDCHGTVREPAAILSYFQQKAAGNDAAANALLAKAFSGNSATALVSLPALLKRNSAIIRQHFSEEESIDSLVQKATMYTEAEVASDRAAEGAFDLTKMPKNWTVPQVADTVRSSFSSTTEGPRDADLAASRRPAVLPPNGSGLSEDRYHATLARYAHTVRRNMTWGAAPDPHEGHPDLQLAHSESRMSCYACHSAWNTSCFGCHLPQRANQMMPMLHNEGLITRNYTSYNFQTLRDDIYMLGVDSTVKGHKIVPVRSACAVIVSSQNANRDWVYSQQQTVSAEGFAGTAFSPNFPHTVRAVETKQCTDCHVSRAGDNNAVLAQVAMQGTKAVNFIGRYAWVAEGDAGLQAVVVSEREEPQAVIGSRLHELAYPDYFARHNQNADRLTEAYGHGGTVLDVQLRGEYLYAACGTSGFIASDVANIDNKNFSQRIMTAPVSSAGQRLWVATKFATSVCSPSTMALSPARSLSKEDRAAGIPGWRPQNEEGRITEIGSKSAVRDSHRKIHPLYAYLYVTDRDEGLIVIGNALDDKQTGPGVTTLLDGNPENNFLQRAATFNPNGLLNGARHMDLCGTFAYISCDAGVVVLDLDDPLHPRHVATLDQGIRHPRKVAFQFRYGFVVDDAGVQVIDVTFPEQPRLIVNARVPITDARDLYVCRTYGYVAAGRDGLIVLDLKRPEYPRIDRQFTASGRLNDATAVRVGMTNTSLFAYVADGFNGLKVVQLTSPDDTPEFAGFSPRPAPRLIAWFPTPGRAISLSEGLDRDRAVDESGNQLSVFGRRGSRPFTLSEQRRLYFHHVVDGKTPEWSDFYQVSDFPDPGKEIRR